MERIITTLGDALGPLYGLGSLVLLALVVFLAFLFLGRVVSHAMERVFVRDVESPSVSVARRAVRLFFGIVGAVMALHILGLTAVATSLLATGGLVAVILGFAFREIGENLLAGIFLGLDRSFEVGDLVETSGHLGKVKEIALRHVHLRSADGRDIYIPSAEIFRNVLVNFTQDGLLRGDFTVGVDYADSLERAGDLLRETAAGIPGVLEDPETSVRLSGFTPQYAEFQVFFWVDALRGHDLTETRTATMHACIRALKEGGFTLSSNVTTGVDLSPVKIAIEGDSR